MRKKSVKPPAKKLAPKTAARRPRRKLQTQQKTANETTRKVGLFGGTFNPIHYGHLNSIESVFSAAKLDEIWVIPNRQNPLKEAPGGPTPEQRLESVKIALSTLDENKFKVLADEVSREGVSYTVETIERLMAANPGVEFSFILGADQLADFSRWKNYKKILKLLNLIVTSRPGAVLPRIRQELPPWLSTATYQYRGPKIKLKSGNEVLFVQLNDIEVSATEIRRKLRRNENVSNLLPSVVANYLVQNKIYDKNEVLVSDYSAFTKFCAQILLEKGGLDIRGYDVRKMIQPAEFTLVTSGTSTRHTKALCEHVVLEAKNKYGILPQSTEGQQEGRWVIVDYGALMIHIFYDFVRGEYRIEDLWAGASQLVLSKP